jgi:hypothetical protein
VLREVSAAKEEKKCEKIMFAKNIGRDLNFNELKLRCGGLKRKIAQPMN